MDRAVERRGYQDVTCRDVLARIDSGITRVLIVAPTGSGKTVIAGKIIERVLERQWRVLFLAHRRELVRQASEKFNWLGIAHGVVMADVPKRAVQPGLPVQVASVQTITSRLSAGFRSAFDMIIVDEAHRARADSYHAIYDAFPDAAIVGLTATPARTDGRGLGELFQDLIIAARIKELTDLGWLVPWRAYVYDDAALDELDRMRLVDGDYAPRELSKLMGKPAIVGRVVEEWARRARGMPSLYFAVTVEHSQALVREFTEYRWHGGPVASAEHVDGMMGFDERCAVLGDGRHPGRLQRGDTNVVVNCNLLVEGLDVPMLECVGLVAPTTSWGRAMQMIGRGLRPHEGADGPKTHLTIMDHARMIRMHGWPDADRKFALEPDAPILPPESKRIPRPHQCAACDCAYPRSRAECPDCRTPNPDRTASGPRGPEIIDAENVVEVGPAAGQSGSAASR